MRNILFRGKCIENNQWARGLLSNKKRVSVNGIEIIPETLGEYTGRNEGSDNGKEIFEWDIADFTVFDCFDNDTQYRGIVVFNERSCAFELWKSLDDPFWDGSCFELGWVLEQDEEFKVIGNIHDDINLLEENSC